MDDYFRPLTGHQGPRLAGGWCRITAAERLGSDGSAEVVALARVPVEWRTAWSAPRPAFMGVDLSRPSLMGVLNLTPDSFTDGGRWQGEAALAQARALRAAGAVVIDVGGESTRPGARAVPAEEEIARILPTVTALAAEGAVVSVDTRKAAVAREALAAGARIINDVSGLDFDPEMAAVVAEAGAGLIIMHSQGLPETMQRDPHYGDVVLEVFDALAERLLRAEEAGVPRSRIMLDPGIGFGKNTSHNLALLQRLSILHGFGCGLLLGVSRKRFIGEIGGGSPTDAREPGTQALTLAAIAQGVQMHRVHDVAGAAQSLALWQAAAPDQRKEQA